MAGRTNGTLRQSLDIFERLIVLITGVTLITALLYVAGNYQDFSDTTQRFLLWATRYMSGFTVVALGLSLMGEIVLPFLRKRGDRRFRIRRFITLLVTILVTGSILAGSTAITVLQQPL